MLMMSAKLRILQTMKMAPENEMDFATSLLIEKNVTIF